VTEESIREGRSVRSANTQNTTGVWVEAREGDAMVQLFSDDIRRASLTPTQARRLARHLRTISTRIEKRLAEAQP
jgi:hypothetical protein